MAIHVVQGERELVSDCQAPGRLELRGIQCVVAREERDKKSIPV
jgi:molecular chaperone DnaK (HSP70)